MTLKHSNQKKKQEGITLKHVAYFYMYIRVPVQINSPLVLATLLIVGNMRMGGPYQERVFGCS